MVYGHSGDVYDGEWCHDLPHGMGTKCYGFDSESGMYVGEWQRGKQHGLGRMVYPDDDGHTYSGGWFQGRYAGAGTMMKHMHDENGVPKIVHVATGDWTTWTWTGFSTARSAHRHAHARRGYTWLIYLISYTRGFNAWD